MSPSGPICLIGETKVREIFISRIPEAREGHQGGSDVLILQWGSPLLLLALDARQTEHGYLSFGTSQMANAALGKMPGWKLQGTVPSPTWKLFVH